MTDGRRAPPIERVVNAWPDELALDVLDLNREGNLSEAQIRLIDRWRRQLRAGGRDLQDATEDDWRAWGSNARMRALASALSALDPALARVARRPLTERQRAERGHTGDGGQCGPSGRTRTVSIPEDAWPSAWRRAIDRMRQRAATDDLDDLDDGTPFSTNTLRATVKAVGQLARVVEEEDRTPVMTIDLVDAWIGRMAGRGVRHRSITTWLESAHRFGRALGADTDVLGYIRRKANAHDRRARRQRSRKEQTYLDLGLGIGDVFARARELHERAEAGPEHLVSTRRDRLEAALIALSVASPLRCGDFPDLRIGVDIERRAGSWSIDTVQAKTKQPYHVPELWSAVGEIIDALILDGRDPSALDVRVQARDGAHLFTWADDGSEPVADWWPSAVWKRHFGVGIHMIRSMWASHYIDHDPARSWAATAMLGHASPASRRPYEIRARRAAAVATAQDVLAALASGDGRA